MKVLVDNSPKVKFHFEQKIICYRCRSEILLEDGDIVNVDYGLDSETLMPEYITFKCPACHVNSYYYDKELAYTIFRVKEVYSEIQQER